MKTYSTREVVAILKANGYNLIRNTKSSHQIYGNGIHNVSIPVSNKMVNRMLFERLIKENNLKVN